MKNALIIGITGQDGSYLAEALLKKGVHVIGGHRATSHGIGTRLEAVAGQLTLVELDVLDQTSLETVLCEHQPDEIYNLAAQSRVSTAFSQSVLTAEVTAVGALRVCQAVNRCAPNARLFQAGSSEMFGSAQRSPQDEDTPFRPTNPYGYSKLFAHNAVVCARAAGLFACNGIMYNHESPRRGQEFVTRKITRAAARIKLGLQSELRLGNLETRRDWGFAGDFVEAMWKVLQAPAPTDYVIGTGLGHSVREFCDAAFKAVELDYQDYVTTDQTFFRPSEPVPLIANPARIERDLGWSPSMPFEVLVAKMVSSDLEEAAKSA